MKILIFEASLNGHRSVYVSHLIRALERLETSRVTLVTQEQATDSEPYEKNLSGLAGSFELLEQCPLRKPEDTPVSLARSRWALLNRAVEDAQPDWVYLPTADGVAQVGAVMGLLPGGGRTLRACEVEGVFHRCQQAYPKDSLRSRLTLRAQQFAISRTPLTWMHHVDRLEFDEWRRRGLGGDKVGVLPDPVDLPAPITKEEARRRLGTPVEGRCVGTIGRISTSKGCDKLIDAFVRCGQDDAWLLLVGRHSDEVLAVRDKHRSLVESGQIVSIDRFVTTEELQLAASAVDVMAVMHPGHIGISSILLRSLAAQRPVLASDYGWIGDTVKRFDLGWVCDVTSLDPLVSTLDVALSEAEAWRPGPAAVRLSEYNTVDNFCATLTRRLSERLGQPIGPGYREWTWVEDPAGG